MEFPEDRQPKDQDDSAASPATAQSILDSLRRIVRALRISSRLSEKTHGLSVTQFFVMQRLGKSELPLSMNELAQATFTHQSSVSVVVSRLAERRLVERTQSREDARRVEISLTAAGRRLLTSASGAVPGVVQDRLVEAIDHLGQEQGRKLALLLQELVTQAGFDEAELGMFDE